MTSSACFFINKQTIQLSKKIADMKFKELLNRIFSIPVSLMIAASLCACSYDFDNIDTVQLDGSNSSESFMLETDPVREISANNSDLGITTSLSEFMYGVLDGNSEIIAQESGEENSKADINSSTNNSSANEETPAPETAETTSEDIDSFTGKEDEEFFITISDKSGKEAQISSYDYVADISGIQITDLDAFKSEISKLPHLLYIDMCDCGLSNEQMESLMANFPTTRFVWKISMTSTNEARTLVWEVRTDALAFSTLHGYATDPRLTNPDGQQLKYCKNLVALDLGHNAVYDIDFAKDLDLHILIMVDAYNRDRHCKFDDLSVLKYNPNLMYLEFFVGGITDLSFLQYTKEMVDLNISYNPISDSTYLYDLPNIERMYMESTYIPYSEFEKLQKVYPNAQLEYYGSGSIDHGWRGHKRYFAMINMYRKNYWDDLFRTPAELEEVATFDLVQYNGKRYWGTSTTGKAPEASSFTGFLTSTVSHEEIPSKDDQSNFGGIGHPYWVDEKKGAMLVYMDDGNFHWFYSNEVIARRLRNMLECGGIYFLNNLPDIDDPDVDWDEIDYYINYFSK